MEVMGIRMLPVSNVFNKFPRMVRDLAAKLGKKIDLTIEGENTELDRSVIEEINDPLIHLIRNSVDHGIESAAERLAAGKSERAVVKLTARHEQGRIILTVEDDGKGIDPARIKAIAISKGILTEVDASSLGDDEITNLIFASGFSTAKVVNDVSGRGVGLDIVRNNIQRLNGTVMVETEKGTGTRFLVTLPLTLAIVPTLLVQVGSNTLAIPLVTVLETLRVSSKDVQTVNSRPVIRLRDKVLPLLEVADSFGFKSAKNNQDFRHVVVVGMGKQQMGLAVDRLLGQEEVVVKSLGSIIGEVLGIASAAILGDGSVILIVDVQDLFQIPGQKSGSSKRD
jgi:two-component system chemotaxis sensor kinase CheA